MQLSRHPKNVTLEMSLKPFKTVTREAIAGVCEVVFRQWYNPD